MKNAAPHTYWLGHSGICYGVDEENRSFVYRRDLLNTTFYESLAAAEEEARKQYNNWSSREAERRREFNRQIAMD